mgnify:CR=1 FL=1
MRDAGRAKERNCWLELTIGTALKRRDTHDLHKQAFLKPYASYVTPWLPYWKDGNCQGCQQAAPSELATHGKEFLGAGRADRIWRHAFEILEGFFNRIARTLDHGGGITMSAP